MQGDQTKADIKSKMKIKNKSLSDHLLGCAALPALITILSILF